MLNHRVPAAQLGLAQALLRSTPYAAAMATTLAAVFGLFCYRSPVFAAGIELAAFVSIVATLGAAAARASISRRQSTRTIGTAILLARVLCLAVGLALAVEIHLALAVVPGSARPFALGGAALASAIAFALAPSTSCAALFLAPVAAGVALALPATGQVETAIVAATALLVAILLNRQTRRHLAGEALRQDQQSVRALLGDGGAKAGFALWQTDAHGALVGVSDGCATVLGASASDIEGHRITDLLGEGAAALAKALVSQRPFADLPLESGKRAWRVSGVPARDARGRFAGFSGFVTNVGEDRRSNDPASDLAERDMLTDLPNRRQLEVAMAAGIEAASRDGRTRSLLFIDLDGFKSINDTFGHAAGDAVLKAVTQRWMAATPKGALLARFGGDEFALFYAPTEPSNAETLACTLISLLKAPFAIEGAQLTIGASIGIAHAPEHGTDVTDLLRRADLALYRAKALGKGRACLFEDEIEANVKARRLLERDLKLALVRDEFELDYQPIFDLMDAEIIGFEALIRWEQPERGRVSPLEFIAVAESIGIIDTVGRWVLDRACRTAAAWPGEHRIAVNISPGHFCAPGFVGDVRKALQASGLPPTRLEIEITENVFLDRAGQALETIKALRERGIRIALDDFGTGYSSMNYLVKFPVDKIKIDRSFITNYLDRNENRAIVDSIIALARKLSIRVTAEGVETLEQALALKLRRCDDIQGYLISRPQREGEIAALIAALPRTLRARYATLFESRLAAMLAMKRSA